MGSLRIGSLSGTVVQVQAKPETGVRQPYHRESRQKEERTGDSFADQLFPDGTALLDLGPLIRFVEQG